MAATMASLAAPSFTVSRSNAGGAPRATLAAAPARKAAFFGSSLTTSKTAATKLQKSVITKAVSVSETVAVADSGLSDRPMSKTVLSIILGGGAGSRLYPLTKQRSKPAVPIGGAYRLIDVPMSNCFNSGICKIYVLTQFNSVSLNRHLARAYRQSSVGSEGFVEVLAATQTPTDKQWFQGTADAVRQYAWLLSDIKNKNVEDVVILSGDHLYRMDYSDFVKTHRSTNADITVSCLPMDDSRASDFGLMKIDNTGRIVAFAEKPSGDDLKAMEVDTTVLGLSAEDAKASPYIASMGIYVFKKKVLLELLNDRFPTCNDFGSEILPGACEDMHLQAHLFDDYWEDIGTIASFFEANLALATNPPRFEFYDANNPIYTSARFLPPARIEKCHLVDAIVSHGSWVADCKVEQAIVGLRSRISEGCTIKRAMIMGADFYETDEERAALIAKGGIPVGIGAGSTISNTIVDKNARIGKNCTITNAKNVQEEKNEEAGYYIRSGIVTILRNATIADGTTI
mmetsp:Transcript_3009/g.5703  ORF Transcript_3009/g.5703 Transcript_3009/m.5703 type:complete len:514 (+) Transcript_3009:77-1618(+)|eukprot:CAMPEP_0114257996 /NCGR_PEP_ID=MMETSP0058-20121206/19056_1 /TAXON_ID=36894 /ORGANISM="Pyramimonas parkeae, CCMP726" /LENGTH=513 /DNA_ID=CAMNT_0001372811 /DNA_START=48 /DNA_END=1589 /DNA_ORIENTATION=-